jgi:hypothetical protein
MLQAPQMRILVAIEAVDLRRSHFGSGTSLRVMIESEFENLDSLGGLSMFQAIDDGNGYGMLGSTGVGVDAHPSAKNLKTGVLGVVANGDGSSDSAVLNLFAQANVEGTLVLKTAGVVGVTTLEDSGAPTDSVGVYGASSNFSAETLPTYGFLAGRDPTFKERAGVYGESDKQGITGVTSTDLEFSTGVFGFSKNGGGVGVRGETVTGTAVYGRSFGSGKAGKFFGDVDVSGNINVVSGGDVVLSDVAEDFCVSDDEAEVEPGTVLTIDDCGRLSVSTRSYDKCVAGVVSGAANFRPGLVLNRQNSQKGIATVALVGRVFCKADASRTPIHVGDLLTTSDTPGHAMKADDSTRSFGAVIGKALQSLRDGLGLIPILIALQ